MLTGPPFGYEKNGMTVLMPEGKLKRKINEMHSICKKFDVILGSGHLGPEKCLSLADESQEIGYDKIETTHPNACLRTSV